MSKYLFKKEKSSKIRTFYRQQFSYGAYFHRNPSITLRATLGEGANCHAFPVAVQLHRWTTKVRAPLSHLSNFLSSPISSPKRKISSPSSTLWRLFENPRPWFYDLSGDSAIARSVNVARPLRNFTTRVHVSRCESASRRVYPFFAVFPLRLLLNISRLSFLVTSEFQRWIIAKPLITMASESCSWNSKRGRV